MLQLLVIMLDLLVVREKHRFGVSLISGRMVCIVKEVQIVSELFLHHFNLGFSKHASISAEVFYGVGLKLVG